MAEPLRDKVPQNALRRSLNENSANIECAVCLQTCVHPAKLPCGHIFCYLCIKGIVNQGRRCAMCRQDIPVDYLDKPRLLKPLDTESSCQGFEDGHLWFYEGHNGWWQYDERTSLELESAYQKGERCCELLIAGYLYIADFDTMLQYRNNDPCRRRRIKRDLATITKKGVAGLKSTKDCSSTASSTPDVVSNILVPDLESLHISGQPTLGHGIEHRVRRLSYPNQSISSQEQPETAVSDRTLRSNSLFSLTGHSSRVSTQNDLDSHTDSHNFGHTNNFELDNIINDTLDWTIDQIESLNLELANDYENLLREVDNYALLSNILDVSGPSASSNDSSRQHSVPNMRPNRSLVSRSLSSTRSGIPEPSHSEENRTLLETPQVSSCENNSRESERLLNGSLSVVSSTSSSQTPFETSIAPRRPRRVSPSLSSSLRNRNVLIDSKK